MKLHLHLHFNVYIDCLLKREKKTEREKKRQKDKNLIAERKLSPGRLQKAHLVEKCV